MSIWIWELVVVVVVDEEGDVTLAVVDVANPMTVMEARAFRTA
jgi:hypothetical protein